MAALLNSCSWYAAAAVQLAFVSIIYCLKRLYGLDLELRTYREDLRAKFARAKLEADEAEESLFLWHKAIDEKLVEIESRTGSWSGTAELVDRAPPVD